MTGYVLVVDDEPGIRDVIEGCLCDEGYRVLTASNGQEALDDIARERPVLVLLDLQMPVLQGWEVLLRLRALGVLAPVVFISAASRIRDVAAQYHADGYLAKPFNLNDLLATVARFVPEPQP